MPPSTEHELTDPKPADPFLTASRTAGYLNLSDDPDAPGRLKASLSGRVGTPHALRLRRYSDENGTRSYSPWSAPQSVTTAGTPRAAPSVTAAAVSPTSVRFTEEADKPPYEGYSYYSAQLHADQWFTASDGTDPATGASATLITGLAPGTAYRFAVRRKAPGWISGGAPDTAPAFVDVATPPAAVRPPQSPDSLVPSQRLGGEGGEGGYVIDLAWRDATTPLWSGGSSSDPPDDFVVERAEMVDGPYGPAYGPFAAVGTAGAATPFFTDAAALPEVEYAYRVRARNAGGLSVDRPENNAGARITLPRVGVFSDVPVAGERAGDPGQFVFERDGDLSKPLTINFELPQGANVATPGQDYEELGRTATFSAGMSRMALAFFPIADDLYEVAENVVLNILPSDAIYRGVLTGLLLVATARVDNALPSVTIKIDPKKNKVDEEGKDAKLIYTVKHNHGTAPLDVYISFSGSTANETGKDDDPTVADDVAPGEEDDFDLTGAEKGAVVDGAFVPGDGDVWRVSFPQGADTVQIKVTPKNDAIADADSVRISLLPDISLTSPRYRLDPISVRNKETVAEGYIVDGRLFHVTEDDRVLPADKDASASQVADALVNALKAIAPNFSYKKVKLLSDTSYDVLMDYEQVDLDNAVPDPNVQQQLEATKALWDGKSDQDKQLLGAFNQGFAEAIQRIPANGRGTAFGHQLVRESSQLGITIFGAEASATNRAAKKIGWNTSEKSGEEPWLGTTAHTLGHEIIHVWKNLSAEAKTPHQQTAAWENMLRYESKSKMKQKQTGSWVTGKSTGKQEVYVSLILF